MQFRLISLLLSFMLILSCANPSNSKVPAEGIIKTRDKEKQSDTIQASINTETPEKTSLGELDSVEIKNSKPEEVKDKPGQKDNSEKEQKLPNTKDSNQKSPSQSTDTSEKKNVDISLSSTIIEEETKTSEPSVEEVAVKPERFSHDIFNDLLSRYVNADGVVNYSGFKKEIGKLNSYLELIERTSIDDWARDKRLAFWINLYNAATIKLILDNQPIISILDLDQGKVWDRKWIAHQSNTYSLNQIENEIIRPQYKEPRIHFAVNCAAKSCPPLLNMAWTEANLERKLNEQTKRFINNSSYNILSPNKAEVSKIFEWYAEDFGDLLNYLNQYAIEKIDKSASISYLEYDWSLNGK